ncbi:MAG: ComF family protein [Terracidiphilus sp.]|nr:ComF family protein [Terracidiphilus sp.]
MLRGLHRSRLKRHGISRTVRVYCRQGGAHFPRASQVRCVFRRDSGSLTFDVPPSETTRWRAVARVLRSPLDALGCALLPAICTLCGSPLPQLSSAPICSACWAEFPALTGPSCARCGDILDQLALSSGPVGSALCRSCRLAPPPFVRAVAYGLYQDRMKAAIHALKYDRMHPAARVLGRMLAEAIAQLAAEAPAEMLVVPVPLHRSKYGQRGFNQARSLAAHALGSLRKTHPQWRLTLASSTLMRLRATESQAGLSPRQRRINVRGAFSVSDPSAVTLKHVLIVDDIFTTGATARSAASALNQAGAASVWVATLARARNVNPFRRGASVAAEDYTDLSGNARAATLQGAFIDSSQDQSSF